MWKKRTVMRGHHIEDTSSYHFPPVSADPICKRSYTQSVWLWESCMQLRNTLATTLHVTCAAGFSQNHTFHHSSWWKNKLPSRQRGGSLHPDLQASLPHTSALRGDHLDAQQPETGLLASTVHAHATPVAVHPPLDTSNVGSKLPEVKHDTSETPQLASNGLSRTQIQRRPRSRELGVRRRRQCSHPECLASV